MASRRTKPTAPPLNDQLRQQLVKGLQPFQPHEAPQVIYRRNAVTPVLSIRTPGAGRFVVHGVRLLVECAQHRGLPTRVPGALQRLKSAVPGILIMEPVVTYDPRAVEQYELKWYRGNSQVNVDLLPILQPLNLEVPKGYVMEVPLSVENLSGLHYLLLHLNTAKTRAIKPDEKKKDGESEDDDDADKKETEPDLPGSERDGANDEVAAAEEGTTDRNA